MLNLKLYYRNNIKMFTRYFEALEQILPDEIFFDNDDDEGGNFPNIESELDYYFLSATTAQGATKLVIIPNELNVVIKVGAAGQIFRDYDDDTEDDNDYVENYEYWNACTENDYCAVEVNAYNEIAENYAAALPFFLPNLPIQYGNHTYYIQESIDCSYSDAECGYSDKDDILECSEKSRTFAQHKMRNSVYSDIRLASTWVAIGYEKYGADAVNALFSFLTKTEAGRVANDDFHYSNFGFYDGDMPVIFDYAGYRENS